MAKRPLRVLVLAPHPFFQNRGTPIAVRMLVETLAGNGYAVDVLTYHEGEDPGVPGVRLHRIPAPPGVYGVKPGPSWKKIVSDVYLFFQCLALVRRAPYDLIHAVEESAFVAIVASKLFGVPYVYDMDSSLVQQVVDKYSVLRPFRRLLEPFERAAVRRSVGVVAVCKALEELAHGHDPAKAILRLEDVSLLDAETHTEEDLRSRLGIPGPLVMYVGNLEKYQGIDLLLEAFRLCAPEVPEARLVIIGGSDGDVGAYRARARDLGIGSSVHLVGPRPVSELGCYLRQADVLVSPRTQGQNTPMKIYSYLDSGAAVLATDLPTHTQVLDTEICSLAPPEPAPFARGLATLLQDEELRKRLARKARERVKQEFSREAFERKLLGFYESLESRLPTGA